MTEKFINSRIQLKVDTAENWGKAENFIPLEGELILYSDTQQIKLGDGVTKINNLPVYIENAKIQQTEDGGVIIGGQDSVASGAGAVAMGNGTTASGDGAVAMGEEAVAAGDSSFAQGGKIFRSGAEPVTNAEGKYYAVLDGEYALAHPENCVDVATYPETEPPIVQTSDGIFCYLHDVRYAEAHGYASMTAGQGAIAYSRASKSLGYRTQTGYVTSPELAEKRPEAEKYSIKLSDFVANKGTINGNQFTSEYSDADLTLSYIPLGGLFNFSATCMPIGVMNIRLFGIGTYEDDNEEVQLYGQDEPYFTGSKVEFSVEIPTYTKKLILRLTSDGTCDLADVEMEFYPNDNTGQDAMAIGADTVAAANQSFAGGWKSKALAHAAFAFGMDNEVKGGSAASFGSYNKVNGANSLAIGDTNTINMNNSFAAGANNTVGGNQSIVVGSNNVASGKTTQAIFGIGNEADRIGQTVVGLYNVKDTNSLFVVGNGTDKDHKSNGLTVGFSSTDIHNNLKAKKNIIGGEAEIGSSTDHSLVVGGVHPNTGKNTKATSQYNFVFGRGSQATKWGAMALGDSNTSSGFNSLATGANTEALNDNSATFGKGTKTGRISQTVVGEWNKVDTDALFVVGKGSSESSRSNAFKVNKNGNVNMSGILDNTIVDSWDDEYSSYRTESGEIKIGPISLSGSQDYFDGYEQFHDFNLSSPSLNASSYMWPGESSNKFNFDDKGIYYERGYSDFDDLGNVYKGNFGPAFSFTKKTQDYYDTYTDVYVNELKVSSHDTESPWFEDTLTFGGFKLTQTWIDFNDENGSVYERTLTYDGDATFNGVLKANNLSLSNLTLTKNLKIGTIDQNSNSNYSIAVGNTFTGKDIDGNQITQTVKAQKEFTLAFGRGAQALGWGAISIGDCNKAGETPVGGSVPYTSIAIGANNICCASNAIACGSKNEARISGSAVFGIGNKTANYPHEQIRQGQFICGTYNDFNTINNAKLVVGCGSSDSARKNAFVVRNTGDTEVSKNLTANGIIKSAVYDYIDDLDVSSGEIQIGDNASISCYYGLGEYDCSIKGIGIEISTQTYGYGDQRYGKTLMPGILIEYQGSDYSVYSEYTGSIGSNIISFTDIGSGPEATRDLELNGLKIKYNSKYMHDEENGFDYDKITQTLSYNGLEIKCVSDYELNEEKITKTLTYNGQATFTDLEVSGNLTLCGNKIPTFYSGTDIPDDSIGALGDIYIRTLNQL